MRLMKDYEICIARALCACIPYNIKLGNQDVWVVNPEMGSIRPAGCTIDKPVHPISLGDTKDRDGVFVLVTLLLTKNNEFGELDFWKVDDTPIEDFIFLKNNLHNIRNT